MGWEFSHSRIVSLEATTDAADMHPLAIRQELEVTFPPCRKLVEYDLNRFSMHIRGVKHIGIVFNDVTPITLPLTEGKMGHNPRLFELRWEVLIQWWRVPFAYKCPYNPETHFRGVGLNANFTWEVGLGALDYGSDTFPISIVGPTMVTTTERAGKEDTAAGKHRSAVRAPIHQCGHLAFLAGKENDVFTKNLY
jgi:hypothetical protein